MNHDKEVCECCGKEARLLRVWQVNQLFCSTCRGEMFIAGTKAHDIWKHYTEKNQEARIQAEHVAAGRVCMIVSMAGADYITKDELQRRYTPDEPLTEELIAYYRRIGTDEKLIEAPRMKELAGPIEGGPGLVRYETWEAYEFYSGN
ncbi:hypothetical protein [Paenibacillus validus]|uniref:hypothetical protein n=1 Tax=Paenibacillus validus TaxID=44253 RepID=UPI003D267013